MLQIVFAVALLCASNRGAERKPWLQKLAQNLTAVWEGGEATSSRSMGLCIPSWNACCRPTPPGSPHRCARGLARLKCQPHRSPVYTPCSKLLTNYNDTQGPNALGLNWENAVGACRRHCTLHWSEVRSKPLIPLCNHKVLTSQKPGPTHR